MRQCIQRWARRKGLLLTPHALSAIEDALEFALARGWYERPSQALRDNDIWRFVSEEPIPNSEEPVYAAALCHQCERIDDARRLAQGPDGFRICGDCYGRVYGWLAYEEVAA